MAERWIAGIENGLAPTKEMATYQIHRSRRQRRDARGRSTASTYPARPLKLSGEILPAIGAADWSCYLSGRQLRPNHHAGLDFLSQFPASLLRAPVCLPVLTPSSLLRVPSTIIVTCTEFNPIRHHPGAFIASDQHGWYWRRRA